MIALVQIMAVSTQFNFLKPVFSLTHQRIMIRVQLRGIENALSIWSAGFCFLFNKKSASCSSSNYNHWSH